MPVTIPEDGGMFSEPTPTRRNVIDPLDIVSNNTPNTVVDIDEGSGMLSIQSESTTPQSGVNGIVETGGVATPTNTGMLTAQSQPVTQTPPPEQDTTSFLDGSFLSSKVISERGVEEYNTAKSQVDALVSQGKDPSQFDINGAPIGLYGGQVSAKDYLSSIAIPRQDVEQVYDRDTWLNALNAGEELNTTVRDGQTMVLTSAVPEGGYAQFMVEDPSSPLGFAVSPEVKSREAVDAIWRGFAIESGIGDMSANDKMTLAFQNDYYGGDWKQKKDGSWTFELNDPSDLKKFQNVMNPIIKAYASYMLGQAVLPDVTSAVESLNLSPSVTTGISKATSNAIIQKATTGEVDLGTVILSGTAAYADSVNAAVTDPEYMMGLSEAEQLSLTSQAQMLENVKDASIVANAIETGDPLRAISGSMNLMDLESPIEYVNSYLSDTFGNSDFMNANGEVLSQSIVKVADKLLEGESVEDAIKRGVIEYVQEGGSLEGLSGDGENALFDIITDGVSSLNENVIQPVVNTVGSIGKGAFQAIGDVAEGTVEMLT